MKKNIGNSKFNMNLILIIILFSTFSCRKNEVFQDKQKSESRTNLVEKFLSLPDFSNPQLVRIVNAIRKLDQKQSFIDNFAKTYGLPKWQYSKLSNQTTSSANKQTTINRTETAGLEVSSFGFKGTSVSGDTVILIPLVLDGAKYVNGFLACKLNDTVSFKLYGLAEYKTYGYKSVNGKPDANLISLEIMMMEYRIFGHDKFGITDSNLVFYRHRSTKGFSFLQIKNKTQQTNNGKIVNNYSYTTTIDYGPCYESAYFFTDPYGNKTQVTPWIDNSGPCGIITTVYWVFDTGSSFGSGLTTSTTSPPSSSGQPSGTAGSSGFGAINSQGYYYSQIDVLINAIKTNPYTPIPCDYLNQFYNLGNYQVPQTVLDKINTVATTYSNIAFNPPPYYGSVYIQNINDASGAVVNCDYFPVHISQLPTVNGVLMTPDQLFEYFRLNLNSFVDNSIAAFSPYNDYVINETNLWNSNNPLGAILHLDMLLNGSVIVSDYSNNIPFGSESHFTVSTLRTPLDNLHPVSGNRRWGIQADPTNGGYLFYTTGIDRITTAPSDFANNVLEALGQQTGFDNADNLWKSLQTKMINFISANGGSANLYQGSPQIISRPPYDAIKSFLQNPTMSFGALKSLMGCS